MLRGKSPPLVPTTWLMVTLMVVDPPSCEAHMIVVDDVHAVDEHTAASDAVGLGSQIPKFMPLKVKLVPLPKLAGAFAAAEPIVSTGAAAAKRPRRLRSDRRCRSSPTTKPTPAQMCGGLTVHA